MEDKITSLRISKFVKKKLDIIGKKGETYEDIIIRLINNYKGERR